MKHFPVFLAVEGRRIVVSGGGEAAVAKLRLLMKTDARIAVFTDAPAPEIETLARSGKITLVRRAFAPGDTAGAVLFYAANEDAAEDARVAALAEAGGALVNIVDNLEDSRFITPAIVDRDPVTVAIGTEGAAPVLARAIKAELEERLPPVLGVLARFGKAFRKRAEALPFGGRRRAFWADYYFRAGPAAVETGGEAAVRPALDALLTRHLARQPRAGRVDLVGAGPGDPELLTLKARKALDAADVVIHDRLVAPEILELARREAILLEAGKEGFGPHTPQEAINAAMIGHARKGLHVVRLKSGDPGVFGRLDEEIGALEAAGVDWRVVPGLTAASAAVAAIGQSLTRRGRNSSVRILTGHDVRGFAEHDWRQLARRGEVAAVYMGKKSARFVQGRLMMHGADPATPVTVVENASRPEQQTVATTLAGLPAAVAGMSGPAIIFLGLAPRHAGATAQPDAPEETPEQKALIR